LRFHFQIRPTTSALLSAMIRLSWPHGLVGVVPDQDGSPVKLSDLKGQTVVLYFYPKADT
jgi:hypothetical protein